jgi:hypothetical protein
VALTTIEIQTNITLLETALARGEKDVTYRDRRVTYNSAEDMLKRLQYFKGLLSDALGGRPRQTLLTAEKGL